MTKHTPWWKSTVVYQIYPRSFYDTNGDGIGDIQGIIAKLDELRELGVETIWCSPFFASPQADFGYDISDYRAMAPEYGELQDALSLIEEVHKRDMRIVFDMVMNHTSDQHPWFQESRQSLDNPKRDWYIWRPGKRPKGAAPPNNWKAMIGGRGWQYDAQTDEWYWATFLPFQPDLNYRNPAVKKAMLDHVRFWLSHGVDGFRLDIFNAIFKDESFQDNPFRWRMLPSEADPDGFFQENKYTINHEDTFAFAKELRAVIDEFDAPERFLVGEVFGSPEVLKRYCGSEQDGLHLVFLFETLTVAPEAPALRELLASFESHFPAPYWPTYVFGNHDRPRRLGRLGLQDERLQRLLVSFQMTARGVPFVYYGEELGMPPTKLPLREALDPMAHRYQWVPQVAADWLATQGTLLNRDECRTPMLWDDTPHAGFTDPAATPWLPVRPAPPKRHLAAQKQDPGSLWHFYRRLLHFRKEQPMLQRGELSLLEHFPAKHALVAYTRSFAHERDKKLLIVLNFEKISYELPAFAQDATVLFSSLRELAPETKAIRIEAFEALVLFLSS